MISTAIEKINRYFNGNVSLPFFVVCDNLREYTQLKSRLHLNGNKEILLSNFCRDKDTRPVLDDFFESLNNTENAVVYGLGEYLGFLGEQEAKAVLGKLKDVPHKTVVILRGLRSIVEQYHNSDPRFDKRRVYFLPLDNHVDNRMSSFTFFPLNYPAEHTTGFKTLLQYLENGKRTMDGKWTVEIKTALHFPNSLFSVKQVSDSYSGIMHLDKMFNVPFDCGTTEQWDELLQRFKDNGCHTLTEFLTKQKINFAFDEQFRKSVNSALPFDIWLYFIAAKHSPQQIQNDYLRFAVEKSQTVDGFVDNVLNDLLSISHKDKNYQTRYKQRKELLQNNEFYNTKIADYAALAKEKSPHYLTDNTLAERQAIIEIIGGYAISMLRNILPDVYPSLAAYLQQTDIINAEITTYFQEYKEQKLFNKLQENFIVKVNNNASSRPYSALPTRNELVQKINKDKTLLYFVDAFGVEFLGIIYDYCKQHGLTANVEFGRSELPTITSLNKRFYEEWSGAKKETRELDGIKHGNGNTKSKLPLYLAEEIDVVVKILKEIESVLRNREYSHVVIASDHGASRLVVLNGQNTQHETTAKSEHNGRCVKFADSIGDISNAIQENGYWILSDYSRFTESRAAAVEVHGGAALEEVIVPVITFSLTVNEQIKITLINDNITHRPKQPVILTLLFNVPFDSITINLNGKIYCGEKLEDRKHRVVLSDIKTGKYTAEVLQDNNSIGNIAFTVQSPAATENDLGL